MWVRRIAVDVEKQESSVTSKVEELKYNAMTLVRNSQHPLSTIDIALASIQEIDKSVSKLYRTFLHDAKRDLLGVMRRVMAMDAKPVGTMPPNEETGCVAFTLATELHRIENKEWAEKRDVQPKKMIALESVESFIESKMFLEVVLQNFTQ
jgi:hypothetical protein